MHSKSLWTIVVLLGAAWVGAVPALAASTVRTIQIAGTAQMQSLPPGRDGIQQPEFAPTFANDPNLQDGTDASSGSGSRDSASASLKQARQRFLNRSIARGRGLGE